MMGKRVLKKAYSWYSAVFEFLFTRLFIVILFAISIEYLLHMMVELEQDTTQITNAIFVIMASLSALSFSGSRCVRDSDDERSLMAFAGERFLHSCILSVSASILKYSVLLLQKRIFFSSMPEQLLALLSKLVGIIAAALFFFSVVQAFRGLSILNKQLWKRLDRK